MFFMLYYNINKIQKKYEVMIIIDDSRKLDEMDPIKEGCQYGGG